MREVTPSNRRRLQRLGLALVVGILVGQPRAAISEEGAPNRRETAARGEQHLARSRPMPAIYGPHDTTVVPPVPRSRNLPAWHPAQPGSSEIFTGDVELVVGEGGRVLSASILDSIETHYDGPLLASAKGWTFTPATKRGVPVKFRYIVTIRLVK